MKAAVPLCDILKVSDEEMVLLSGSGNLSQGSAALTEMGPFLVLITLGADGVFYRMGASTGHISGRQVTVADTNGAGDTFFGAVLCELAKLPGPGKGHGAGAGKDPAVCKLCRLGHHLPLGGHPGDARPAGG